ncbi:hypothetical protein J6590_007063 [Homalodisca vitripennis]|nr:hypothetical protein J6590_007063 [Homalodisca vitripennis]
MPVMLSLVVTSPVSIGHFQFIPQGKVKQHFYVKTDHTRISNFLAFSSASKKLPAMMTWNTSSCDTDYAPSDETREGRTWRCSTSTLLCVTQRPWLHFLTANVIIGQELLATHVLAIGALPVRAFAGACRNLQTACSPRVRRASCLAVKLKLSLRSQRRLCSQAKAESAVAASSLWSS